MDPSHSRRPATAGDSDADDESSLSGIFVSEPAWRRHVPHAETTARRAARIANTGADIVLASDREVRRLNARDRGRNKPTNVLTYPAPAPGLPGQSGRGEIVLALGTVLREARAAGRRPVHHLAHLIVHGALHLAGHDHHHPGEARRMERAEARLLHRIRVPNPWRQQ